MQVGLGIKGKDLENLQTTKSAQTWTKRRRKAQTALKLASDFQAPKRRMAMSCQLPRKRRCKLHVRTFCTTASCRQLTLKMSGMQRQAEVSQLTHVEAELISPM